MSAHSPGPWRWSGIGGEVNAANGSVVHDRHWTQAGEHGELERSEADARLIAAAPEMFAALKVLLDQVHADCLREGEDVAVNAAYALIARIEAGT